MTDQPAARPSRAKASPAASSGSEARPKTTAAKPAGTTPRATRRAVAVPVVADPIEPTESEVAATTNEAAPADATSVVGDLAIRQGGIGALTATDVTITQGGVGALRAERLSVEQGGVGAALTDQLVVRQGLIGAVIARDAQFEQAGVRTLVANRVEFGPQSGAAVVIAAHVDGDVRPLFDWRTALAFGVAAGLVGAIFRFRRPSR